MDEENDGREEHETDWDCGYGFSRWRADALIIKSNFWYDMYME